MNNNNHNGKEVHRGQMPENVQSDGKAKPVNRIRKKKNPAAKDTLPGEPKKIALNVNKNPRNPQKSSHKGQVIKLGDKDPRIHPVETTPKENRRPYPKPAASADNRNTLSTEPTAYNKVSTDNKPADQAEKESFQLMGNTGKWLLIVAAILFVAWAVIFFYYNIGGNSHMILALSVICAIVSLVGARKK